MLKPFEHSLPFALLAVVILLNSINMDMYTQFQKFLFNRFLIPRHKKNREVFHLTPDNQQLAHIDHVTWDACLRQHVSKGKIDGIELNVVDYINLSKDSRFDEYRNSLANLDLDTLNPNQKLSLYINAYNCFCVGLIIDYYRETNELPSSINDLSKTKKVWSQIAGNLGGQDLTLDHIEHQILRKDYADPRIHASIVCASVSCPDLRPEAFQTNRLQAQMDDQMEQWMLNKGKGFAVLEKGGFKLSKIFLWFSEDFSVKGTTTMLSWLKRYLPEEGKQILEQRQSPKISYFDYNWNLNKKHD